VSYGDSDLDPFGPFSGPGPELELDLPTPAPKVPDRKPPPAGGQPAREPSGKQRRPPPDVDDGAIPRRALELAEHGDAPALWSEITYAVGVVLRMRALRRKLPLLERVRDASKVDLDKSTLDLGRALHGERAHPRAQELGTPLRVANARYRLAGQGQAELDQARAEAEATTREQERLIKQNAESARPAGLRARELSAQIVVFQQDFEAASEAIQSATTELAALEKSKTPDPNRRIELQAMCTNRRVEADAAVSEIDARTPELKEAEARVLQLEKASEEAEATIAEARALVAEIKSRIDGDGAEAQAAFERALVDLADEAVRLRLDYAITPTAARRARLHFDTYVAHQRELEMHELALTLSHRGAVSRGLIMLVLLSALFFAGFVYTLVG